MFIEQQQKQTYFWVLLSNKHLILKFVIFNYLIFSIGVLYDTSNYLWVAHKQIELDITTTSYETKTLSTDLPDKLKKGLNIKYQLLNKNQNSIL